MPSKNPRVIKTYRDKHYLANKEQYLERNLKNRVIRREFIINYKKRPCEDCDIEYPYYVMDLDHRPDEVKLYEPHKLAVSVGMDTIKAELQKCDVVCANCHRLRTASREASI